MNKYLGYIVYVILLSISLFGGLAAGILGLSGIAIAFVGASENSALLVVFGLVIAMIGIILLKVCVALDPSRVNLERL
jgi:type IV secretory pathway TrbD component